MFKKKTILVAEGDVGIQNNLFKTFSMDGYGVELAQNAMEALQFIDQRVVDIAIVDTGLSDIKPELMVRIIKKCSPYMPIISLSSEDSKELEQKMWAEGVFYYSTKPVTNGMIKSVVKDAVKYKNREPLTMDIKLGIFKNLTSNLMTEALNILGEIQERDTYVGGTGQLETASGLPLYERAEMSNKCDLLRKHLHLLKCACKWM